MIKKLFLAVAIIFFASSVFSQNFAKGDKALNVGIGLGWSSYVTSLSPIPSFNASFEAGIVDIPNVGVIGVGGFGGFRFSPYTGGVYTNTIVAGRGVFHFQFFDTGDFDLYAGAQVGIGFTSWNYNDNYYDYNNSYLVDDVFVGARWMKNDKFGFFGELGYGISYLKAGIVLKF
ncbi:MAG: hypothetical protein L3J56_02490 [Bacteroidales bacterium]|nr:hypothetical protein [Bacteroidales bacterium]